MAMARPSPTRRTRRALQHVSGVREPAVFVFSDLHAYFGSDGRPGDAAIVRATREAALEFRHGDVSRTLPITAPVRVIPAELDELTSLMDYPLPTPEEIRGLLDEMIANNTSDDGRITVQLDDEGRERLAMAALGLTMSEAENAFARAMVNDGQLVDDDLAIVLQEKSQVVRKSGVLEFLKTDLNLDDVGGLTNLKRWLSCRKGSWLKTARAYGLPSPKGGAHHGCSRLRKVFDSESDGGVVGSAVASPRHWPHFRRPRRLERAKPPNGHCDRRSGGSLRFVGG